MVVFPPQYLCKWYGLRKKSSFRYFPRKITHTQAITRPTLEIIKIDSKLLIYAGQQRAASKVRLIFHWMVMAKRNLKWKSFPTATASSSQWEGVLWREKTGEKWSKEFHEKSFVFVLLGIFGIKRMSFFYIFEL